MASILIRDVRIFTGEEEIPNGSVLVEEGKINSVSRSSIDPPSPSMTVISKPGHTLLPGLIDAHIHADKGNPVALPQSLRFGVTTVCDMQNEPHNVVKLRKQAESKGVADFKTCSLAATIKGGWPEAVVTAHDESDETAAEIALWPKLESEADAQAYVDQRVKEDHVDYIKLMHESGSGLLVKPNLPDIKLQKAVIKAAHANDLVVVAHCLAHDDTVAILHAGVDGLTHTFLDKPPSKQLVDAYKLNNAHCNPTLAAIGSLTQEGRALQEQYAHDPRVQSLLGESEKARLCQCMSMAAEGCTVENAYESVRQLKAAGVDIVCGSDAAGPAIGTAWGLSIHQEMALFVDKCGFTPLEALRSASSTTMRRFRFHDRGLIAPGLKADLVLVEGNPLENIDHTLDLRAVWRDGVLCSAYEHV
ncbi:hypothetical protein AAFC00_004606 [Neodothiora populina]|uniref:Amidohydrolase-related domain-containing protein n=1 Tax=Neodothiora populina TaxID=2781224 RepID=A0ABR3P2K4_9PEZI